MPSTKPRLEVCLSPALLHLFDTKNAIVVIIDVFRATSTIAAALHNGAKCVIPVATVPECIELGKQTPDSITAGERDGKVAEGLQYGNSPSEYPEAFVKNKTLVLTTTNGTRLLHMVKDASVIITGSFLNLSAVADYLNRQEDKNVLLACAAWKDRFNLEDSLFAGAVAERLKDNYETNCDSTRASAYLYQQSKSGDIISFLKDSSHYRRLSAFGLEKDMEYCATPDLHPVVPVLKGRELRVFK
jgi:2-phosphosulfolactate phosphatase